MGSATTIIPATAEPQAGRAKLVRDRSIRILQAALRRIATGLVTLWGAVTLVFLFEHMSGDPAELLVPPTATEAVRQATAQQLGLDQPLIEQYGRYLGDLVQGNFGNSFAFHQPAGSLVLGRLPATLELAGAAMLIAVIIGVPLGLFAAFAAGRRYAGWLGSFVALGQAIPPFLIAPLLISLFGVEWHLTPVSGRGGFDSIILPAVSLALFQLAVLFRVTRGAALRALRGSYVEFARAKGATPLRLAWQHVLPNSLIPLMTVSALALATLIGGSVIVETIFNWPGIGYLLIQAVQQRDFPIVSGVTTVFAAAYIILNMVVDILYAIVDPRTVART
jgi:peptide/nickel transport system permease protein